MAEKVEIDPCLGAAPFLAAQNPAVKGTGLVEVGDMDGEMKEGLHHVLRSMRYFTVRLRGRSESGSAPLSVRITVSEAPTVKAP